jgi:hypothetical protein
VRGKGQHAKQLAVLHNPFTDDDDDDDDDGGGGGGDDDDDDDDDYACRWR